MRCRIPRKVATVNKPKAKPILTKRHKMQRRVWIKKYLKQDFSKGIFSDNLAQLWTVRTVGRKASWIVESQDIPFSFQTETWARRRRSDVLGCHSGKILYWTIRVTDRVNINSQSYTKFLDAKFIPLYEYQTMDFQESCIFMQDNAPSHPCGHSLYLSTYMLYLLFKFIQ